MRAYDAVPGKPLRKSVSRRFNLDQSPISEISQPDDMDDNLIASLCSYCHKPMKLVQTIANLGSFPELFVLYCAESPRT